MGFDSYIAIFFELGQILAPSFTHYRPPYMAGRLRKGVLFTIETRLNRCASTWRSFCLATVHTPDASILQESLPGTSGHACHHYRLRSAPGAERTRLTFWCV